MSDTWNNRVVIIDDTYTIQEVYYKDDKPVGYADPCLVGDDIEELARQIERFAECLKYPVLTEEDFKDIKNTCLHFMLEHAVGTDGLPENSITFTV